MGSESKIPLWEKGALTLEEASDYSNIGINKLREITDDPNCKFVMWVGRKRLIKKKRFDAFLDDTYSI